MDKTKSDRADVFAARCKALRNRLSTTAAGVDAILITEALDIRYLTGFVGEDSWMILPMRGRNEWILSDTRFEEQIQNEAPQAKAIIRKRERLSEVVAKLCGSKGWQTVGVQPSSMTLAMRKALVKELGAAKRIKPIEDGLLEQRSVKDASEVQAIRDAVSLTEQAFLLWRDWLKPGITEYEAAAYLEYQMRRLGADGRSFPSIIASGPNGSLPHAIPGKAKVKRNVPVLVDWGAISSGYCGDLTRVVVMGKMPAKIQEIYKIVLEAQLAGIDAIRPGVRQVEVHEAASKVIEDAGYGDRFGHGLGHGLGLEVHELPVLSPRAGSKETLQVGEVVTVEPGIYLPGVGGVRIEDDVLVTEGGYEVLSKLPKSLEWAMM